MNQERKRKGSESDDQFNSKTADEIKAAASYEQSACLQLYVPLKD
jgi:hypothetical protein